MDPNNNQQINTQQAQQPNPVDSAPIIPSEPAPISSTPKSRGKKGIILLIILLILVLGMGIYVLFVKNQLNNEKKAAINTTTTIVPTATIIPTITPATVDEVQIASPESDLNGIEADAQGL